MSAEDIRITADVFLGVMFWEVVGKPIAIRIGKWGLRRADGVIRVIPDWLYDPNT
jgi:hypothetical protein